MESARLFAGDAAQLGMSLKSAFLFAIQSSSIRFTTTTTTTTNNNNNNNHNVKKT
jgi:hypothetical protein